MALRPALARPRDRAAEQARARIASRRRAHPRLRRISGARGQSLVEFSLVAVVLFPFLFALVIFLLNLAQSWSLGQATSNLGATIVTTGAYDEGTFIADSGAIGFPIDPSSDTLEITVTPPDGSGSTTFTWGDSASFTVDYGDLVSIQATKDLRVGPWANIMATFGLPNARVSWNGIAQRNTADVGSEPDPIPTTGEVTGTVRDAADGSVISGVLVDFGGGHTATSNGSGRYAITLSAGYYSLSATKSGYQDASTTVTVASGVTTVRDFTMESAAIVDVAVSLDSANSLTNGDFESGTAGWTGDAAAFTVDGTLPHSGSSAGVVTVDTTSGGGIFQTVSDTFTAGHTYRATVFVYAESGAPLSMTFGNGGDLGSTSTTGTGGWQQLSLDWTPTSTFSSAELDIVETTESGGPATRTLYIDDAQATDTAGMVSDATVTTSSGLTATYIGDGHYRLVVAPGAVTIQVNTSTGEYGSTTISHAAPGTTTYVYITITTSGSPSPTPTVAPTPTPAASPTAAFDASPTSGDTTTSFAFSDSSTGTPTSWAWDFGDGTSSTSQNPTHTYASAGIYTVALTVTNTGGSDTLTRTDYLSVSQIVSDTFTESSGTVALTAHTADTGDTWQAGWSGLGGDGVLSINSAADTVTVTGSYSAEDGDGFGYANATATVLTMGDGYVQAYLPGGYSSGGLILRQPSGSPDTFYELRWGALYRETGGVSYYIAAVGGSGDWYRFQATGVSPTTLSVERRSSQGALGTGWTYTTTDNTAANQVSSGRAGVSNWNVYDYWYNDTYLGVGLDNFYAVAQP